MSETVEVELHLPLLGRATDHDPTVQHVQLMLNVRGFGPLEEDGEFGPKTEASVKSFQGHHGISQGGHVGAQTWAALLTEWLTNADPS